MGCLTALEALSLLTTFFGRTKHKRWSTFDKSNPYWFHEDNIFYHQVPRKISSALSKHCTSTRLSTAVLAKKNFRLASTKGKSLCAVTPCFRTGATRRDFLRGSQRSTGNITPESRFFYSAALSAAATCYLLPACLLCDRINHPWMA